MTTTLAVGRAVATVGAFTLALAGCSEAEQTEETTTLGLGAAQATQAGYENRGGNRSQSGDASGDQEHDGSGDCTASGEAQGSGTGSAAATDDLSADIEAELLYLIEEEKLAHDVYITLDDVWDARVFENIAASETQHTEAVEALLETYGIDDPRSDEVGVFADASLQELYDDLTASGTVTWADAVDAGIAIETTDIADLEDLLARELPADVATVVANLLKGSENHLAAFERQA